MELRMFSVYDVKAEVYHPPVYCHNEAHAQRFFCVQFLDSNSMVGRFPHDFKVFEIGVFNDENGIVLPLEKPRFIVEAVVLLAEHGGKELIDGNNNRET